MLQLANLSFLYQTCSLPSGALLTGGQVWIIDNLILVQSCTIQSRNFVFSDWNKPFLIVLDDIAIFRTSGNAFFSRLLRTLLFVWAKKLCCVCFIMSFQYPTDGRLMSQQTNNILHFQLLQHFFLEIRFSYLINSTTNVQTCIWQK